MLVRIVLFLAVLAMVPSAQSFSTLTIEKALNTASTTLSGLNPHNQSGGERLDAEGIDHDWSSSQKRTGGYYTKILPPGANGKCPIRISPKTFKRKYPDIENELGGGFDAPFAETLLAAAIFHELMHKCLGVPGPSVGAPDCRTARYSCEHLAIEATEHATLCAWAASIQAAIAAALQANPEADVSALCGRMEELENKWNSEFGVLRANECTDGCSEPASPCPYDEPTEPSDCPVKLPDPPDGGPCFHDLSVLAPCGACSV